MSGKNIALFCDGTGNSAASLAKTNVWRLYRALDVTEVPAGTPRQIARYSDGVGTSSFRPLALLGGIFGVGLSRNVIDMYKFVCRNYRKDDQIYVFGFSRGAFTARIVAGLILDQGVIQDASDEELDAFAIDAYRDYRRQYKLPLWDSDERDYTKSTKRKKDITQTSDDAREKAAHDARYKWVGLVDPLRALRDAVVRLFRRPGQDYSQRTIQAVEKIRFLGVWDTVSAYGLPVDEWTRGIDAWVWPLSMPNYNLSKKVETARHALALDEERHSFHPLLWDESGEPAPSAGTAPRLLQVWFAGVHSNVGGGYADDTLSYVPRDWIAKEAASAGLRFQSEALCERYPPPNPLGRIYDSRAGVGGYYRYQPRKLAALMIKPAKGTQLLQDPWRKGEGFLQKAIVHHSVRDRIERGTDRYAPISLPANLHLLDENDEVVPWTPPGLTSAQRERAQEWAWNDVWQRRVMYFATLAATLILLIWPLLKKTTACEGPFCLLSPIIEAVGSVLPGFMSRWVTAFANNPAIFAVLSVLILMLMARSETLRKRIRDRSREVWDTALALPPPLPPSNPKDSLLYKIRSSYCYQRTLQILKWNVASGVFGIAMLALVIGGVFGSAYLAYMRFSLWRAEETHSICERVRPDGLGAMSPDLWLTAEPCWPFVKGDSIRPDLTVERGATYRVTLQIEDRWVDKSISADPRGFGGDRFPFLYRIAFLIRRSVTERWFQPMARIVSKTDWFATKIQPLEFTCACGDNTNARGLGTFVAEFKAAKTGSFGIFVNDGVIAAGLTPFYYRNNHGSARVTLTKLKKAD